MNIYLKTYIESRKSKVINARKLYQTNELNYINLFDPTLKINPKPTPSSKIDTISICGLWELSPLHFTTFLLGFKIGLEFKFYENNTINQIIINTFLIPKKFVAVYNQNNQILSIYYNE